MVSISGVIFILVSLDGRLDFSDNSDLPCSFSRFIQRYNVERAIPHEGQFLSQNPFRRIAQVIFGASVFADAAIMLIDYQYFMA